MVDKTIVEELRNYALGLGPYNERQLLAIADRIDDKHQRAVYKAYEVGCECGLAGDDEFNDAHEGLMARHGWVKLPVDNDGEVVRVGSLCKVYPFGEPAKKVRALRVSGLGWFVIFEDGTEEQRYRIRVCNPPTTEDVLREFAGRICAGDHIVKDGKYLAVEDTDLLAEYAKRLQLKEVDE